MTVKFCSPVVPDFDDVEAYLLESTTSGHLSNFGPLYKRLCNRLRGFLGLETGRDIVLTSSGHTALMAAYAVLGVKRLVVPAYTFESTRSAATLQGIEVLFADVDPASGCITPETLAAFSPDSYDAVVAVCALSTVPDLARLRSFCSALGKKLIIDGAPAFGTPGIFNYGDAFCLSMHATKSFSVGEGGAVIANPEVCGHVRKYINFGYGADRVVRFPGINGKISEYSCAVAMSLLDHIDYSLAARRRHYALYRQLVGKYLPETWISGTVYAFLPLFLESEERAQRVLDELSAEGFGVQKYYSPLVPLPVSRDLYVRNVSLPVHQDLSEGDIQQICSVVNSTRSK